MKSKKVDVKELVKGHNFTICLCKDEVALSGFLSDKDLVQVIQEEGECDCEGLMEVTEDLQGTISNAYMVSALANAVSQSAEMCAGSYVGGSLFFVEKSVF